MYTDEELARIREANRRYDLVRDPEHQQQYEDWRKQREAEIEAQRQQQNPALAARLAAIRQRMAEEAKKK